MGKQYPNYKPREVRIRRLDEVSLGFNKKIAQDEARRCPQCAVAVCLPGCPLGIDIPGFIRLLREGEASQALERIKQANPFPAICGRVCPAPCEEACIFHEEGQEISIRELERFAADNGGAKPEKPSPDPRGKKVAIIGSGPAGMTAAYYLARSNFSVTIFEAAHEPGGLLRYAIPEFRLPQKVLDEQFAMLKAWGVEIQTDVVLGRTMMIDDLFMRGYGALLLAVGASLPVFSDLPGASLGRVYYAMEFLYRLQTVDKEGAIDWARRQGIATPKTVVIGRGPSAFDAARLSVRLGSQTQIVFDGFEEEAEVGQDILKGSREEGVELLQMRPLEIMGDAQGSVRGVKCLKLEVLEEKSGLKLEASKDEPLVLEAQTVIIANGQKPNNFIRQALPQLRWGTDGSLGVDGQTGMTSMEKIFATGSVATAGGSVVEAIAGGKRAAQKITEYLNK